MASIEYINNRITGKQKEIEKLEKKLVRIEETKATNWEVNPYYYSEYDLQRTQKDLANARTALANYQAELKEEENKETSRNVPAITEFLNRWEERVVEHYSNNLKEVFKEKKKVKELYNKYATANYGTTEREEAEKVFKTASEVHSSKLNGYYEYQKLKNFTKKVKIRDGEWEYLTRYIDSTYEASMEKVKKAVAQEKKRKYDNIVDKTVKIVGTITDATNLTIGEKGDLNGYIIGTESKASVNTFGAGGYNVQCFHFRTTIKKIK